jgi:2-oxoisovalerate ferredoxin oxidoreductase beta subunit
MKTLKKPDAFYDVFERKPGEEKQSTTYCPGCGHGIIHKLIGEALVDLEMTEKTTFISPVGCSVFGYYYFKCGNIQTAHGRAPAVATGIARAKPDSYVISYQGDGDLAAIGTAEIIHAANRGENITVIFVNNAIYGMTGGQMAPTSLVNQKTATTPNGRSLSNDGHPIKISEMISTLTAPVLVARSSVHNIKNIFKTRKLIRKALKAQKEKKGFTFVEILSPCPTNWKVAPDKAAKWIEDNMLPYYKTGVFVDRTEETEDSGSHKNDKKDYKENIKLLKEKLGIAVKQNNKEDSNGHKKLDKEMHIKISGFGGQGVLSAGVILCETAVKNNYFSTWIPSYGPEMRGGTANCSVILSNRQIASPVFDDMHILIALNQPSFDKFNPYVKDNGTILYNSSIIDIDQNTKTSLDKRVIKLIPVDGAGASEKTGNSKSLNMVFLGKFIKAFPYFIKDNLTAVIEKKFAGKNGIIDINKKAVSIGYDS